MIKKKSILKITHHTTSTDFSGVNDDTDIRFVFNELLGEETIAELTPELQLILHCALQKGHKF